MNFELPLCIIPFEPDEYLQRVSNFIKKRGKTKIGKFVKEEEKEMRMKLKNLIWDNQRGLRNLTLEGGNRGLDLSDDNTRYMFHNIHNTNCPEAQFLFNIARYYITELYKIN